MTLSKVTLRVCMGLRFGMGVGALEEPVLAGECKVVGVCWLTWEGMRSFRCSLSRWIQRNVEPS